MLAARQVKLACIVAEPRRRAASEDVDVLLSWNFKHIVKLQTRRVVSATSRVAGYKEIEMSHA